MQQFGDRCRGRAPLIILVDGYNVIKQVLGVTRVPEPRREQFINDIIRYARKKGHKVVLVFDGGSFGYPYREQCQGVTVIYSGYKETADDVIKGYIAEHRSQEIVLVSSDRELRTYAHALHCTSVPATEFYQVLTAQEDVQREVVRSLTGSIHKMTQETNDALDQLMIEASQGIISKSDDALHEHPLHRRMLSKKERAALRIRKKL